MRGLTNRWTQLLSLRPVRFLIVGGINTVVGYALFVGFYLIIHQRPLALACATVIGVAFNYFSTGRLVFSSRGYRQMIPFFLGYGVVFALNLALLEGLCSVGVPTLAAQAVVLPATVALSYLINRYFVFAGGLEAPATPALDD